MYRAALCLALLCADAPARERPDVPASLQRQCVTVFVPGGHGSGVVERIGGRVYVWTVAHVTRKVGRVNVESCYSENGKEVRRRFTARVLISDEAEDVALCALDGPGEGLVGCRWSNAPRPPRIGSRVWCVGTPLFPRYGGTVTAGVISFTGRTLGDGPTSYDQHTAATQPGNSGGGVFDSAGRCLGLLQRGIPGTESYSFHAPNRRLRQWLATVPVRMVR